MPDTKIKQIKTLDNNVYDIAVDSSNVSYDGSQTKYTNKNLNEIIQILDTQSSSGGEVNVIEQIKRNGIILPIDSNKSVNIEVPTSTSDLTNDGDGISPFATQDYVDTNSGDENVIETVKVNNVALTPDSNKAVNITVPTKTSDLTNDSNFVSDANYVHTDNNYTTTEKNKLAGIEAGAEVNVQSDWNQTNTAADDFIKNKPDIQGMIDNLPASTITNTDITNWNLAEKNVQSDWNQSNSSSDDYIKNKPPITYDSTNNVTNVTGKMNVSVNATGDNDVPTYKQVRDLIGEHVGVTFTIVNSYADLPATGDAGTFYLVPNTGTSPDTYDEYIWVNNAYELIGNTNVTISSTSDTFVKSYPGSQKKLVTASITPAGTATTAVTSVSVSGTTTLPTSYSASTRRLEVSSIPAISGVTTGVTEVTQTTTTIYGTGTTTAMIGATVSNGVLSFTTANVANGTSATVVSSVTANTTNFATAHSSNTMNIATGQLTTSGSGAEVVEDIGYSDQVIIPTGITSTTTNVATVGSAVVVATGSLTDTSVTTNVGATVLEDLGTAVTANAITSISS